MQTEGIERVVSVQYRSKADGKMFDTPDEAKAHTARVKAVAAIMDAIGLTSQDALQTIHRIVSNASDVREILVTYIKQLPRTKKGKPEMDNAAAA